MVGNSKRELNRETRLHNYANITGDQRKILSDYKDVLIPDSKNKVEPLNDFDRKRENAMSMTTHQVTLNEIAKNNFKNKTNLLSDFTYVGY